MKDKVTHASEWGKEPKLFCPFCGAPDEKLTYHVHYDRLTRRDVADVFCNKCGKAGLIIEIWEESERAIKLRQKVEQLARRLEEYQEKLAKRIERETLEETRNEG